MYLRNLANLLVFIFAGSLVLAIFALPRLFAGTPDYYPPVETPPTVISGSSGDIEPTPDPEYIEPDGDDPVIEAGNGEAVSLTGYYIHVPGSDGFLQLETSTTIIAPDPSGEIIERANNYSVSVPESKEVPDELLEFCNSKQVIITGPVYFNEKKEPCVEAQSITDPQGEPIELP